MSFVPPSGAVGVVFVDVVSTTGIDDGAAEPLPSVPELELEVDPVDWGLWGDFSDLDPGPEWWVPFLPAP